MPGQAGPGAYFTLIELGADLGEVSDTDTAISASIDAEGNVDAVLTVDVDSVDPEKDYEVISWPTRSNPSEDNLYGRAVLEINWDELDIPDNNDEDEDYENGTADEDEHGNGNDDTDDNNDITVTVNDSSDASVRQGEETTFSIAPVTEGTEFNVTVQSDPIELDAVTADESNSASTT